MIAFYFGITGFQNGLAIAGDYMSAATLLGITSMVYFKGYDGFVYAVCFFIGWPIILFLMAERLRNLGKFTFADIASYRLDQNRIRTFAAIGSLTVVCFYLIVQMVGAGQLIQLLFGLEGQAGRLFKPLAYTKTFVMLSAALLSVTFAPALRDLLIRGKIRSEVNHPISRLIRAVYEPFVYIALRRPITTLAIGVLAVASSIPVWLRLGSEFMPALNEGDILYMPTTLPGLSIEEAKRQLARQDAILAGFPEVERVFGKVGRAETPTDPAPLSMVETLVMLKPPEQWPTVEVSRWHSGWAPDFLHEPLAYFWPETRPESWDELVAKLGASLQLPGWTGAYTMPIRARVDMLTTMSSVEAAQGAFEMVQRRV